MENIETNKEYVDTIQYIREWFPDFVAPHETFTIKLTVREYYEFKQIFKHEYTYIEYSNYKVIVAAKKYLLQTIGYGLGLD
jgi:hypothetical protein